MKYNPTFGISFAAVIVVAATIFSTAGYTFPPTGALDTQIRGGHDTNPVDHGRPVILISSALGVPEAVFRDAFSRVHPAPGGQEPDPAQVDRNKQALLNTLAPYGVQNDRLDEVSNFYRYQPESGYLWQHREARISISLVKGKPPKTIVIDAGCGYSSKPKITVPGHPEILVSAEVRFTKNLATNGSLQKVTAKLKP